MQDIAKNYDLKIDISFQEIKKRKSFNNRSKKKWKKTS